MAIIHSHKRTYISTNVLTNVSVEADLINNNKKSEPKILRKKSDTISTI